MPINEKGVTKKPNEETGSQQLSLGHIKFEIPIRYPNGDLNIQVQSSRVQGKDQDWECTFENYQHLFGIQHHQTK